MALRFVEQCQRQGLIEVSITGAAPQHAAQIQTVFLTETEVEGAIDCQADTVAGLAKML